MIGGRGSDILKGGTGNDIIFGDLGLIRYFNPDGSVHTQFSDGVTDFSGGAGNCVGLLSTLNASDAGNAADTIAADFGDNMGTSLLCVGDTWRKVTFFFKSHCTIALFAHVNSFFSSPFYHRSIMYSFAEKCARVLNDSDKHKVGP